MNLHIFWLLKPSGLSLTSMIFKIRKEYTLKKIDGNNRKLTGNNAVPIEACNAIQRECFGMYQNHYKKVVTNPSLNPRKATGIGLQYFLYRYGTKCTHLRKELKFNEGEDL
jgi:hypothetical protein